ncbi:MAG: SOS response-associated peptidase [Bacteroidota bacterium]
MCGRMSSSFDPNQLKATFDGVEVAQPLPPNYNVAPTQAAYVITNEFPNIIQALRWGLVPFWAKDEKMGSRMINARSETISTKPSFKAAIKYRRCLVLADSFYEWKLINGSKQPYRIMLKDHPIMVMAGIWETWSKMDNVLHTFSIITTTANEDMSDLHDRMPVIFTDQSQYDNWLTDMPLEDTLTMLTPLPESTLTYYPVSKAVNSVRNNGIELHHNIEDQPNLFS